MRGFGTDKGERFQNPEKLADVICEWPPGALASRGMGTMEKEGESLGDGTDRQARSIQGAKNRVIPRYWTYFCAPLQADT